MQIAIKWGKGAVIWGMGDGEIEKPGIQVRINGVAL